MPPTGPLPPSPATAWVSSSVPDSGSPVPSGEQSSALVVISVLLGGMGALVCLCSAPLGGFLLTILGGLGLGVPAALVGGLAMHRIRGGFGRRGDAGLAWMGILLGAAEAFLGLIVLASVLAFWAAAIFASLCR